MFTGPGIPLASGGEVSPLFGLLTLVLVGVVVVSLVLLRFRQSLLVGYFVCGVILANSGLLDWVGADSGDLDRLADLGVILLLFTLGLEFSFKEIKHLRRVALVGGSLQVGLVGLVAGGACLAFGFDVPVAIALAIAVALSSTAVSIKAFQDLGMADSPAARVALGVAIFQDLLVIFFMIVLPPLLGQGGSGMASGLVLAVLKGALFLGACWFLSRHGIPQILHAVARTRSRELFTVTVVGLCAAVAFGAVQLELSAALGAFAAGLVVSESIYSHRVLADILPFRDLFLTIFFVSIGLLIDLGEVAANWALISSATLVILMVKFGVGFIAARRLGVSLRPCLLAAGALASTGEFSLVLLERIADFGVFDAWPEVEQLQPLAFMGRATVVHAADVRRRLAAHRRYRGPLANRLASTAAAWIVAENPHVTDDLRAGMVSTDDLPTAAFSCRRCDGAFYTRRDLRFHLRRCSAAGSSTDAAR